MNIVAKYIVPILLLIVFSASCSADSTKNGKISVDNRSFDFGYLPIDFRVVYSYFIKNTGNDTLHIDRVENNCDCTVVRVLNKNIAAGDSTELKIIFHTKNYYGQTARNIIIYSDDPDTPELEVSYSANIGLLPKLYKTDPISLIFLPSKKNKTIKIINYSEEDIEFALEYQKNMLFDLDKIEGEIDSKDSIELTVSPKDNIPGGNHYNNFTVIFKSDKNTRLTVPVKIVKY